MRTERIRERSTTDDACARQIDALTLTSQGARDAEGHLTLTLLQCCYPVCILNCPTSNAAWRLRRPNVLNLATDVTRGWLTSGERITLSWRRCQTQNSMQRQHASRLESSLTLTLYFSAAFSNFFDPLTKIAPRRRVVTRPFSNHAWTTIFFTEISSYFACTPSQKETNGKIQSSILIWQLSLISVTVGPVFPVPVLAQ